MTNIIALILAGGQGKRMDILCQSRPKPVLPFAGSLHVIDFSLSNCVNSEVRNIAVLIDYRRFQMNEYLANWRTVNNRHATVDILEPQNGSYQGTADAIYQNIGYLRKSDAELVLILAGDHIYQMDYRKMIASHCQSGADLTVGITMVPIEQAGRFGTVELGTDSRITHFVEKSSKSLSNLASMGIYLFNKDVLIKRLMQDAARTDSSHDFGYAVIPNMVRHDKVFAHRFDGYWQDIGCKDAYFKANLSLVSRKPCLSFDNEWRAFTTDASLSSIQKFTRGDIHSSLISPRCVIRGQVINSVLSTGVRIEEHATVRNSILMPGVSIGYHSVVDHCILDEGANIARYCTLGFGDGLSTGEEHVTVVGRGAMVPPHTAIGRSCVIMPFVRPVDFQNKVILSDTTVFPTVDIEDSQNMKPLMVGSR